MESLEIHSKSFLVKWADITEPSEITWKIHPLKKSINFGLYRCKFSRAEKPDAATMRRLNLNPAALQDHLKSSGFEIVHWHGRCNSDELLQGHYEVLDGMEGTYALFFDNTFSKNTSKTVLFSQQVSSLVSQLNGPPSPNPGSCNDLNRVINSTPSSSCVAAVEASPKSSSQGNGLAPSVTPSSKSLDRRSMIDLSFNRKSRPTSFYANNNALADEQPPPLPSFDPAMLSQLAASNTPGSASTNTIAQSNESSEPSDSNNLANSPSSKVLGPPRPLNGNENRKPSVTITTHSLERNDPNRTTCITDGRYIRGPLLKKRRKKLQGYGRRYFSLDFKQGTFDYYLSEKNSILRGSMPIKICAITAKSHSREIFVDSGMEVWSLKALSVADFKAWTEAFDNARAIAAQQQAGHSRSSEGSNDFLKAALFCSSKSTDPGAFGESNEFDFSEINQRNQANGFQSDHSIEGLSDAIKKLEAISAKAKEAAGTREKTAPAPTLQRRASFWRRRASKHSPQPVSQDAESVDSLAKVQKPESSGSAMNSNTSLPLIPKSPLLSEDLIKSGSISDLSKVDFSDSAETPFPSTASSDAQAVNVSSTSLSTAKASPSASSNSPNTLLEISQSIDKVVDDLNFMLTRKTEELEKMRSFKTNGFATSVRSPDNVHNANDVGPLDGNEFGFNMEPRVNMTPHHAVIPDSKNVPNSKAVNRLSDSMSVFSADEFFDAQQFTKSEDGVVYIDKEEVSESSEDEAARKGNEGDADFLSGTEDDDDDDDEEEEDVTVHTYIAPVASDLAEVENVDGEPHLYPLEEIKVPPKRRTTIPPAAASPPSLISLVRKSVGKDLSTIAMPVSTNEPITILQRMCEIFEYNQLIDKAFTYPEGSAERLMMVAVFANSYLSSGRVKDRATRKPFNPLLGETFEMVRPEQGIRVVTEKVSHRPAVMAIQAESASWIFQYSPNPHQQFWGKSAEINNKGTARLSHLPSGEVYEWEQPTTFLRNVIAGEKYVEPVGSLVVVTSNGSKATIEYKSGSMFSGRSEELKATVYDANGQLMKGYGLEGKWTQSIAMTAGGKSLGTVWEVGKLIDNPSKKFGFTEFAASLNEITSIEEGFMAPTDSRLRPDQRVYEEGDVEKAETWKLQLEENQRQRRKEMEEANVTYVPKFFELDEKENVWKLISGDKNYWKRRRMGDWTANKLDDLFTL